MATNDLQTNLDIIDDFTKRLQVAVIGAEETTAKHEKWVEGMDSETIQTANGPIKTLRGIISEWQTKSDAAVNAAILGYDSQFQTKLVDFENEFINYLLTIGFEPAIIYQPGITLVRRSQTIAYQGVTYYWGGSLPYTTNGNFSSEPSWLIAPISGGIEIPSFSFSTGGTLVRPSQTVLGSDGEWYFWGGAFPKVIAPSSTIDTAGGIGTNKFRTSSGVVPSRSTFRLLSGMSGFTLNDGSFEYGATITSSTQTLVHFGTGKIWRWGGSVPKIVPPGSTPSSAGGLGQNLWNELLSPSSLLTSRESLRRSYSEIGLNLVNGSFELGGTISATSDVLLLESNGVAYSWDGALPKVVAPFSTPNSSGGIGSGLWLNRDQDSLRKQLSSSTKGATLVQMSRGNKNVDEGVLSSGIVRGNDAYNFSVSGASFNRYLPLSSSWSIASGVNNFPINTFTISAATGSPFDVEITYKGSKIGTLLCGVSKNLASDGVTVGAEVAADKSTVSLGAPCSFMVDFDNSNAITQDSRYFGSSKFSCSISAAGQITITHPQRRLMQIPLVQHTTILGSEKYRVHNIVSSNQTSFSFYLVTEAKGKISYGTSWSITDSIWGSSDVSMSYDAASGTLTVTHPAVLGTPSLTVDALWNGTPMHVQIKESTTTGFKVVFTKFDGTFPALSNALGIYFNRGMSAVSKTATGKIHVYLGNVQVDMSDFSYQNGSFWSLGVMRDDTV